MRFDDFMCSLECDMSAAKNLRVEKTKDIQGRPYMYIRNGSKVLAEVYYRDIGSRSVREVKLVKPIGECVTENTSGVKIARELLLHLAPYADVRNSSYLVKGVRL